MDYIRGYFDAEGGVPGTNAPPYIYFAQKDLLDLEELRQMLLNLGILCGSVHNPSARADPDYWRFYVSHRSHRKFATLVGSWHPRKAPKLAAIAKRRR